MILAGSGMTDVFVNVLWPGQAHYETTFCADSYTKRVYGDQLKQCLAAAQSQR